MKKRITACLLALIMLLLMMPTTVNAARAVTKSEIQAKLDKMVSDLGLGEAKTTIKWYWNADVRSTDTLKKGLDAYVSTGDVSKITAHMTNQRCAGRYKNKDDNTHSYTVTVSGRDGCDSNWISSKSQKQCLGFATYIEYYLFGEVHPDSDNFTTFTLQNGADLQIGDHIRKSGHSFIYYGLNSNNEIIALQCNGYSSSYPCGLNFGRVYKNDKEFHDISSVKGATIYRYNNVTSCAHEKYVFNNDYSVTCTNCGYNYAVPAVSGGGQYLDVIGVNGSGTAPSHVTPYGEAQIGVRYNKGDTVYVVGSAINAFKNPWYKLSDGSWLSGEYLGTHKHTKVNGYCTRCTDKLEIVQLNNIAIQPRNNKQFPVHFAPYGVSIKYYRSGNVTVTGKVVNGYKNVWYRLSDGGWVFADYLKTPMATGIVKISGDTLALNNKAASSGSGNSTMLSELSNGTVVYIYTGETVGKWYSVRTGNKVGYAYSSYITVTDATKAVEASQSYEEPGISASDIKDMIDTVEPVAPSTGSVSVIYPTESAYLAKFAVSETNAVVVANVRKASGTKVTACGLLLYDANGNLIKDHKENISNVGVSNTNFHTWYDINSELGITLTGGTTYKYRFYTVVDGVTYYGDTYSFTTKTPASSAKASVLYPTEAEYLAKFAVSETNAVVVANIRKNAGTKVTACGLLLYDGNGNLIKDHRESISNVGASNTNFHAWYDINSELGITLAGGTTYKYRFYTVVDGATYQGDIYSFTTTPGKQPVVEEPEQEQESEEEEKVYYDLIFDANGGECDMTHKTIEFNTYIGDMPVAEREGYTFKGWYGAAEGGNLIHENMLYNAPFDVTVYARWEKTEQQRRSMNMWIGSPVLEVNGTKYSIDSQGTVPLIKNSRTLVPIRAIVEAMGGTVEWDGQLRRVVMTCGDHTVEVYIDMPFALVDGYKKSLDVPPEIIGGRTMLPVRFVAENLNAEVQWNGTENRVTILY